MTTEKKTRKPRAKKAEEPLNKEEEVKEKKPRAPRKKKELAPTEEIIMIDPIEDKGEDYVPGSTVDDYKIEFFGKATFMNNRKGKQEALHRFLRMFKFNGEVTKKPRIVGDKCMVTVEGKYRVHDLETAILNIKDIVSNSNDMEFDNKKDGWRKDFIKGAQFELYPALGTDKKDVYVYHKEYSKETVQADLYITILPKNDDVYESLYNTNPNIAGLVYKFVSVRLQETIDRI